MGCEKVSALLKDVHGLQKRGFLPKENILSHLYSEEDIKRDKRKAGSIIKEQEEAELTTMRYRKRAITQNVKWDNAEEKTNATCQNSSKLSLSRKQRSAKKQALPSLEKEGWKKDIDTNLQQIQHDRQTELVALLQKALFGKKSVKRGESRGRNREKDRSRGRYRTVSNKKHERLPFLNKTVAQIQSNIQLYKTMSGSLVLVLMQENLKSLKTRK